MLSVEVYSILLGFFGGLVSIGGFNSLIRNHVIND